MSSQPSPDFRRITTKGISVDCVHCPLRASGAFSSNTPEEISFIQSCKTGERALQPGETVIAEGENATVLFTLLAGWAFRFRTLQDGRRQILNFLLPGDLVGLQDQFNAKSPHGVETLTRARLCVFRREGLWDLYRTHPGLGYDVTWLAAHEERIVDENLLTAGRRNAEERIALLLIHLYKRAEGLGLVEDKCLPFPLNQQHIADALGLSLVHTNKTLKRLAKLGLHELSNNQLRLLNPGALQRLADYYETPLRGRPLI